MYLCAWRGGNLPENLENKRVSAAWPIIKESHYPSRVITNPTMQFPIFCLSAPKHQGHDFLFGLITESTVLWNTRRYYSLQFKGLSLRGLLLVNAELLMIGTHSTLCYCNIKTLWQPVSERTLVVHQIGETKRHRTKRCHNMYSPFIYAKLSFCSRYANPSLFSLSVLGHLRNWHRFTNLESVIRLMATLLCISCSAERGPADKCSFETLLFFKSCFTLKSVLAWWVTWCDLSVYSLSIVWD